jgi:hypothetical protein
LRPVTRLSSRTKSQSCCTCTYDLRAGIVQTLISFSVLYSGGTVVSMWCYGGVTVV